MAKLLDIFLRARAKNRTIYFIGNGGSAATASHFANDLGKGAKSTASGKKSEMFRALSLTDNISWLTALGNDEGYSRVFTGQLENFIQQDDIVVGISASGNSPNVVNALKLANEVGAISVAIVGFDGGEMKKIAHYSIHVPSNKGEYGPVEDVHLIVAHVITNYLYHYVNAEL
jgi:D-sedoheptulose 7-phosphate isomerase